MEATVELVSIECCNCGMIFGVTKKRVGELKRGHNTFYCPSGHGQIFLSESREERLERMLVEVKQESAEAIKEAASLKRKIKKMEKEQQ